MIITVILLIFLGINILWALLRAHFEPRLTAGAKMSQSEAQYIFMPANIISIVSISQESNEGEAVPGILEVSLVTDV